MDITHFNLTACNHLLRLRRERKISWRAFGLGLVISSFAEKDTGEAWPSRAMLSAITGIKDTDISCVVRELRDAGFMSIEEREGRSNIYRLTHPLLATGSNLLPVPEQRPTHPLLTSKPIPEQRPITMKEQYSNNEGSQHARRVASAAASSEPEKASNSEPKATPKKPKVTLNDTGFTIPDALRQSWATAYPGVDIDREAAKAFAWCQSNPSKAPRKNLTRFLNSWLSRAAPSHSAPPRQQPQRSRTGELGGLAQMRAATAQAEEWMYGSKPVNA